MSKAWDNNILKKLKALVGKGLSTAEIGKKLGLSKNAVVGKLHRMGWNTGANDSDAKTTKSVKKTETKKVAPKKADKKTLVAKVTKKPIVPAKKVVQKAKPVQKEKPVVKPVPKKAVGHAIAGSKGISVHQRMVQHALEMANLKPNQCRWPIGDPDSENFHFCGQPVFVGKPYCYEHCKQAYQFTPPKKK